MRSIVILTVASSLLLSACGGWRDARMNPSNGFGNTRSAPAVSEDATTRNPLIPERTSILQRDRSESYAGTPVASLTDLSVERTSSGALVRVTGRSARQGAYAVRLVNETDDEPMDGVLRYTLSAIQPEEQGIGPAAARTVRAGVHIPSSVLERTTRIEVAASAGTLTARP